MSGHNRYLIYTILGRNVEILLPDRFGGEVMQGIVERVCRDIFTDAIEVTLDGSRHAFREPQAILKKGRSILFLYGDIEDMDENDEDIFREADEHAYEGSLHDHLRRTARRPVSQTIIKVGKLEKNASTRWRKREAVI